MIRFVPVAVLMVSLVGPVSDAEAQRRRGSVMVLPMEHPGFDAALTKALETGVREEVQRMFPGLKLLPRSSLDFASMQLAAGCTDDSIGCLGRIGRTLSAARVVRVSMTGSAKEAKLNVMGVRVRGRQAKVSYKADLFDVDPRSVAEVRWHLARAFGKTKRPLTGKVTLFVTGQGNLQGAQVRLDGKKVTLAALGTVPPGRHRIEVRRPDFEPFVWEGEVRPLRTVRVGVRFVKKRAPPPPVASPVATAPPPSAATPKAPPSSFSVTRDPPDIGLETEEGSYTWTLVLGAGTVVAASTATIFAIQTLRAEDDAEASNFDCADQNSDEDICATGRTRALLTNVGWGLTAALGVGAITALIFEAGSDQEAPLVGIAVDDQGVHGAVGLKF